MNRLVLAHCTSGLANRIKGLVTAQRVADDLGVRLRVYWELNPAVRTPLGDLFGQPFDVVTADEAGVLAADPEVLTVRTWRLWPSARDPFPSDYRPPYPSPHGNGVDFAYHKIPEGVRAAIRPLFASLTPHPAVRAAVDAVFGDEVEPYTGVALRTWVDAAERRKLVDLRAVAAAIDTAPGRVFLTSDAPKQAAELAGRWPTRVRTSAGFTTGLSGDRVALCDLLAVARCRRMLVSLGSTFSEVAWWMGGATAEVVVIPPRRYWFNVIDLGEVAAYAVGGRWWFKNKTTIDARIAGALRRLAG